ncbi:MAG: hypothetical protein V4467_03035 [Patescibacteria group bacterium]
MENFNFKLLLSLLTGILTIVGFVPYVRDIFLRKTKPHLYTWLIWVITQITATVAFLKGGGGNYGTFSLIVGNILVVLVFLLAFKYGTKNITKSDTFVLISALAAVVVWWWLRNPWLSVLMISIIDGLGYLPTFRKSFEEPWSETLSYWGIMTATSMLALAMSNKYNFLTSAYLTTLVVANTTVWNICFFRRKTIAKPQTPLPTDVS